MLNIDSLVRGVQDLVTLPDSYLRLREACDDPDNGPFEIGAIIRNDPAFSARLLRMANSPYFGFVSEIDSVPRAVQALGIKLVEMLSLADAARVAFDASQIPGIDLQQYWQRSTWAGSMARRLALHTGGMPPETAFVCGLLHDTGHLVMAIRAPEALGYASAESERLSVPVEVIETRHYGFDYADVGAELLKAWQLPATIIEPVAFHTKLDAYPDEAEFRRLAAALHVAALLARGDDRENTLTMDISEAVCQLLGADRDDIADMLTDVDEDAAEISALMAPSADGSKPTPSARASA
ncbi:MAG: HDOD domain-containing protein [Gammaproteobacteria bacterium]|nr:HDOD domain-containing protein [Gammaproteobacteria bacterium]